MSTVIKVSIKGFQKELEVKGGLTFSYNSSANVTNPSNNAKITFGPVQVSSFQFAVMEPDEKDVQALIKWLVEHKVNDEVKFVIRDREFDASPREIVLTHACLTSYTEAISEDGSDINLEIVGQTVKIGDVKVEQHTQR